MQTDILIVGQGICGTFLSYWLEKAGISFVVIDEQRPWTPSRAAAGLINPVTGRRMVTTWMIDELLPFAVEAYRQIGTSLGISCINPASVVDFFPSAQMRVAFLKRYEEDPSYLQLPSDQHFWDSLFRYDLGFGIITSCYLVNLQALLKASRKRMLDNGLLLEEKFNNNELILDKLSSPGNLQASRVSYRDIRAGKVIFCDGMEGVANPWFSRLPFALNKGEALILEIPELGKNNISQNSGTSLPTDPTAPNLATIGFKKGISLLPWKEDQYWVGASYEWSFDHQDPTVAFRQKTEALLQEWLKVPFRTVGHLASVRPATLERRPFVGFHPLHSAVGILNGMGTKGCSLAPYFAYELVRAITDGIPIRRDADVQRFNGILSRE